MKTTPLRAVPFGSRSKRRGIALILVLACVVLLTVMILAYLASIATELRSSKFYANGGSVKLLAQSTGDLVMAEIRDATADGLLCWASQPGMIRTYDNTGSPVKYYKLYSDVGMTATGSFDYTQDQVPSNWYNQKGVYIDLNQPVATQSTVSGSLVTTNQYPIVDGDSADIISSSSVSSSAGVPSGAMVMGPLVTATSGTTTVTLPQVAGFWVNSAPIDSTSANQVPMPVRWLYVLKDGSIAVPSGVSSGVVSFYNPDPITSAPLPVPSATNPIVGRIAFWTDDETSKVNINTASEGAVNAANFPQGMTGANPTAPTLPSTTNSAVWDIPRAQNLTEYTLALCQPAQNEFQRYPGHPATVCLSSVFGSFVNDTNYPENVYPLTPRISGSVRATSGAYYGGGLSFGNYYQGTGSWGGFQVPNTGALTLKTNPLYATADEFLYSQALTTPRTLNSSGAGTPSLSSASELDQTALRKSGFFITASSRAPDVNLFNQPRVCIWPESSAGTVMPARSPADQLIAFCTTIGGNSYYFQRSNSNDNAADLPTTGGTGLARNRNLMEYLRTLTNQSIPGFGGSLQGKYHAKDVLGADPLLTGTECDQILTEIFDYIRSTNTFDHSTSGVTTYTGTISGFTPDGTTSYYNPGIGQVVPIVDGKNGTRGFGRFPTLHSASLIFFATQDDGKGPTNTGTITVAASPTQIQAVLALQLFDPSMGFPNNIPWYKIQVSGLGGLQWPGTGGAMFPTGTFTIGNPYGGSFGNTGWTEVGGVIDFRRLLVASYNATISGTSGAKYTDFNPGYAGSPVYVYGSTGNTGSLFSSLYPSSPLSGTTSANTLLPNGATSTGTFILNQTGTVPISVTISSNKLDGTATVNQTVQTIQFYFSGGTCVIPSPPKADDLYSSNPYTVAHSPSSVAKPGVATPNVAANGWELWTNRMQDVKDANNPSGNGYPYAGSFISELDSIHSMVSTTGDFRLLAARANVAPGNGGDQFFMTHPAHNTNAPYNTGNTPERFAHELQEAGGAKAMQESSAWSSGPVGGTLVPWSSISANPYYGYGTGQITNDEYDGYSGNYVYWGDIPSRNGAFAGGGTSTVPGDWDNGLANLKDGPYINKADEGNVNSNGNAVNYFDLNTFTPTGSTFFSPNRMMPSAGMFGSLSTGVLEDLPWQTLLFRPGPSGHPGLGSPVYNEIGSLTGPPYTTPPDHLFLDLFTMPVVEPYAISEPLSTAGRINMNYQILPFTYINRSTGVQAVLKSTWVMAMPNVAANKYKYQSASYGTGGGTQSLPYRVNVDIPSTLMQFDARFNTGKDIFRSASEICSIDLIPNNFSTYGTLASLTAANAGTSAWRTAVDAYWANCAITGDNTRERPYANIYPLLTTKSNTFTIHYRVQTLQTAPGIAGFDATKWREGTDQVTGEYRGSQTIERYVDPAESTLPDFTSNTATSQTLAPYYKFRVLANKQFAP